MKVNLIFDLPEETEDYNSAVNGAKYKFVLQDLDNKLRQLYKYENKKNIKIEDVRTLIYELADERGVSINE